MRGLDLNIFDFDYDLSWAALFLNADGGVYGRFGSRDAEAKGKDHTLPALRFALEKSLEKHRANSSKTTHPINPVHAEDYPAGKKLTPQACIHCHHVNEFRREDAIARKTWKRDDVWVYPLPENLGISFDVEHGNKVRSVREKSPAERIGIEPGDAVERIGEFLVASLADARYALDRAPSSGRIPVNWQRGGKSQEGTLDLASGWRETDVSWRWSLKSLKPEPCVHGEDLSAEEKTALGLDPKQLAFRQGNFVHPAARQAGLRINDVIVGVKGKNFSMTVMQFETYVRLNYQPNDVLQLEVLRGTDRLIIAIKL